MAEPPSDGTSLPLSLPAIEDAVLGFWADADIPARVRARNPDGERWVTFEGPPTANNRPALHHVWTSIYKDVYPRFQVMRGRSVPRKGGWDCQGLPVEIEVEKELGFTKKEEIEEYGIAEFNEKCRNAVQRYVADFEKVFRRVGFWVDLDDAYRTMDASYIESVWWYLKQMWDADLLYEGHKVLPYCPRCETALSAHEIGQPGVYQDVDSPSIYVRFPLLDGSGANLLVWTTTPWTVPSNVAVAVGTDMEYGEFPLADETLILATTLADTIEDLGEPTRVFKGSELVGKNYRRPIEEIDLGDYEPRIVAGDFVSSEQGTGLVHIAPAFGQDDSEVGKAEKLPTVNPVDAHGQFTAAVAPWAGQAVMAAQDSITKSLDEAGLLLSAGTIRHPYPHCWRCKTALIYWAKPSWFVRTSENVSTLIAENDKVEWFPPTIKHGRFGKWLEDNIDWALSRDRYWGTPLPIWRCENGHDTCIGSIAELGELAGRDLKDLDPHRPFVDDVLVSCPSCDQQAKRVEPVADVWLDSGCMPAAQWGYPVHGTEALEANYPADFICEAIDQTRGWFYSLLAANTLTFGEGPYRNVLCLGHLIDDEGRKMSKSIGNVIDPWDILPSHGADALRWYLFSSGSPWGPRRVSIEAIATASRRMLLRLLNTFSFFQTYADLEGYEVGTAAAVDVVPSDELDRWLVSRRASVIQEVTDALEGYDVYAACGSIEAFVDDLSNWWLRRSRQRFWGTEADADVIAFQMLERSLRDVALIVAPICPFLAEHIFRALSGPNSPESVHLADWPVPQVGVRDEELERGMARARDAVRLGRSIRVAESIPVRQPLRTMQVTGLEALTPSMLDLVREELNVWTLEPVAGGDEAIWNMKLNFRELGARLGSSVPQAKEAILAAAPSDLRARIVADGYAEIDWSGPDALRIEPGDVTFEQEAREGWVLDEQSGIAAALDLELDEELLAAGRARELIRSVQEARRQADLAVSDRIVLYLGEGFEDHADLIGRETLAASVTVGLPDEQMLVTEERFAFTRA